MPFPDTQPAHLAALAALFGIAAPDVGRARVLELGCASGGNIIPLAARFPGASFTGIDLSRRHIDDGRKRVAELALTNVRIVQADLSEFDLAGEQFDYIICNGVFSWVPKPTQNAIFRLCRQALAPNGVTTISYNVLPGWHLRMVIRDICLQYAGLTGAPQRRVAKARAALEQIAGASDEVEPYGLLLRREARLLKNAPAAYILGEFLAPYNTPCHVQDFIKRAGDFGLDYLCEADLCTAVPQTLEPSAYRRATSFEQDNRPAIEQHVDFITGRPFRRSVLVRSPPAAGPRRGLKQEQLSTLHISSPVRFDLTQSSDQIAVFTDERARPITVRNPVVREAISRLETVYPATLTLDECEANHATAGAGPGAESPVFQAILAMVLAGRASISVLPLRVGRATDDRPRAWSVARIEAMSGQPWITSLRHAALPAHPVLRILLPLLDGTNKRPALQVRLAAAIQDRTIQVPELPAGQPPATQERFDAVVDHYIEWALHHLARQGFFEPAAGGDDQSRHGLLASRHVAPSSPPQSDGVSPPSRSAT
jgi:SAM-dependent methyltransferase